MGEFGISSSDLDVTLEQNKQEKVEDKKEEIIKEKNEKNEENKDKIIEMTETKKVIKELEKTKTLGDVYHIAEFMNLIELLVKADKIKTEITIELDSKTRECFLHIIKNNPEFFSDFEKIFMLILEDNKIDIDDVPHITKLITKLYIIIHNIKHLKLKEADKLSMSSIILKFIVQVLVKEKKINIGSYIVEDFLAIFDELIDSCVNLIQLNGTLGVKNCGCVSFGK